MYRKRDFPVGSYIDLCGGRPGGYARTAFVATSGKVDIDFPEDRTRKVLTAYEVARSQWVKSEIRYIYLSIFHGCLPVYKEGDPDRTNKLYTKLN